MLDKETLEGYHKAVAGYHAAIAAFREVQNNMRLSPTAYAFIDHRNNLVSDVQVVLRDIDVWTVIHKSYGTILNKEGQWEYEPLPSNRDEKFIERTRFPLEQAIALARKVL